MIAKRSKFRLFFGLGFLIFFSLIAVSFLCFFPDDAEPRILAIIIFIYSSFLSLIILRGFIKKPHIKILHNDRNELLIDKRGKVEFDPPVFEPESEYGSPPLDKSQYYIMQIADIDDIKMVKKIKPETLAVFLGIIGFILSYHNALIIKTSDITVTIYDIYDLEQVYEKILMLKNNNGKNK